MYKQLYFYLTICVTAWLFSHAAYGAQILELETTSEWSLNKSTKENFCSAQMKFSNNHILTILENPQKSEIFLNVSFAKGVLDPDKIYETDIYVDVDLSVVVAGKPESPNKIVFKLAKADKFIKTISNAREISLGIEDTLYIFKTAEKAFPYDISENCFKQKNQGSFLEKIGLTLKKQTPPKNDGPALAAPRAYEVLNHNGPAIQAFDLNDKPKNSDTSEPIVVSSQNLPPSQPITEVNKESLTDSLFNAYDFDGEPVVHDISEMSDEELPKELQHIRDYMTDDQNYNESQQLIDSLITQIEILETEKEALRKMVPEKASALSVLRSCSKEKALAADLGEKVLALGEEINKLKKEMEIEAELLSNGQYITNDKLQEYEDSLLMLEEENIRIKEENTYLKKKIENAKNDEPSIEPDTSITPEDPANSPEQPIKSKPELPQTNNQEEPTTSPPTLPHSIGEEEISISPDMTLEHPDTEKIIKILEQ